MTTDDTSPRVFKLACAAQQYAWGRVGAASKVAQLLAAGGSEVDEDKPYAELWMGTHPSAPSTAAGSGKPLAELLAADPAALLSPGVAARFGSARLPFLVKVLSIAKALSIQAHPDKARAEALARAAPDVYRDDNHKPEMALALTDFEALVGFRPLQEIAGFVREYPELRLVLGEGTADSFVSEVSGEDVDEAKAKDSLRAVFGALMRASPDLVKEQLDLLVKRVGGSNPAGKGSLDALVVRLNTQFPGDGGCFCVFFLNYVALKPGEGIFLGSNEPHAYLSGDCVECMATSDNVVRAGLTPKFKDVDTLLDMLTYRTCPADAQVLRGDAYKATRFSKLYDPPIEEFSVLRSDVPAGETEEIDAVDGPSIVVVTQGAGTLNGLNVKLGDVYFIGAGVKVVMTSGGDDQGSSSTVFFRAFCT